MQSPPMIRNGRRGVVERHAERLATVKRGVLGDAPPRGMTMTQNSKNAGNAVGDAGPTTDMSHHGDSR